MKMNKNWVGKRVRAIDAQDAFAPHDGAIGTVVFYDNDYDTQMHCEVRWDGYEGNVWAFDESIELDDSALMPYDEIWKMLQPKMEKNGLKPTGIDWRDFVYSASVFHKAVALAYKMGYERATKGRPFKYGEKKAKKVEGHWEKVDLNSLPPDGTKVRFARNGPQNHLRWSGMNIGDTGVVKIDGRSFGVKPDHFEPGDYPWVAFSADSADCLDYWVEGDDAD